MSSSYVFYDFIGNDTTALSRIKQTKKKLLKSKESDGVGLIGDICLARYSDHYIKDCSAYLLMETYKQVYEFIEFFNSTFANSKVTVIESFNLYCYSEKSDWGDSIIRSEEKLDDHELKSTSNYIVFKISVDERYNALARYILIYMIMVMVRMFHVGEGFLKGLSGDKIDSNVNFDYLIEILKAKYGNSNHYFYCDDIIRVTPEIISLLDDIEFCNKTFEHGFSERGDRSLWNIDIDKRPSQTAIFNYMIKSAGLPFEEMIGYISYSYRNEYGLGRFYTCNSCYTTREIKDYNLDSETNIGRCPVCKVAVKVG